MGGRLWGIALLAWAAGGCLSADVVVCADDRVCPADTVCDDAHGGCVLPEQLEDCAGHLDGDECAIGNDQRPGVCVDQVCLPVGCGDHFANDLEECDHEDLRGATCLTRGFYEEGELACGEDCRYVETGCMLRCGDGEINGVNELCDGDQLTDKTCADFGFYTETTGLRCSSACTFDTAGCAEYCGDGTINGDEECDELDLAGSACTDLGYYYDTGPLACDGHCRFDTMACEGYCNDGNPDPTFEVCDTTPPPGQSCVDYGFDAGHLGCSAFCGPGFAGCETIGWQPMPVPVDTWLRDLWGTAADDLFAVGQQPGTILHHDGVQWTEMIAPDEWMFGIWGAASDDVWAVGDAGTILHWNGSLWTPVDSGVNVPLFGVWGSASDDVWVVGAASTLLHWTGGPTWTPYSLPGPAVVLYTVWGTGPDDVFAAGDGGTILHYADGDWNDMNSPATTRLEGLWGSSGTDVWAVGLGGALVHYDGSDWLMQGSLLGGTALTAIWGRSADDVFVGGESGLVMHYDGIGWSHLETDTDEWTEQFWGTAAVDEVFAVGAGGALAYTGSCWSTTFWPSLTYHDVFAAYYPEVYAAGHTASAGSVVRYFGTAHTAYGMPDDANGVWAGAPDDVWVVGRGYIQHFDGGSWTPMSLPTQLVGDNFTAVWGTGPADVWAIAGQEIARYDGTSWSRVATTPGAMLDVWASGPDDVWVVGFLGNVQRWNGNQWEDHEGVTMLDVHTVWGLGRDDVYVAGLGGSMYHWDGGDWTAVELPTNEAIVDMWGSGTDDRFAATATGGLVHFDGTGWAPVRTRFGTIIRALGGTPSSVFVGGASLIDRLQRQRSWHCLPGETSCGDGADDDCDDLIDLADPDCGSAVLLTEVRGGGASPSWIEIGNQAARSANLGGLTLSYRSACDGAVRTRRLGSDAIVMPGGRFRVVDTRLDVRDRERYQGSDWCDTPTAGAWAALCSGPCDLLTCANVVDYVAKQGVSAPPSPPACASMNPAPVAVSGATAGDGISRVGFAGGGAAGQQSDWAIAAATRD